MMTISCPCCGEKYYSENEFIEQQRFFCEKCNKKFVFLNNRFIPYIVEILETADEYIGACPFCLQKYSFSSDIKGEFNCHACKKNFYVAESDEIHVNPATADTLVIMGTEAPEDLPIRLVPAKREIPANDIPEISIKESSCVAPVPSAPPVQPAPVEQAEPLAPAIPVPLPPTEPGIPVLPVDDEIQNNLEFIAEPESADLTPESSSSAPLVNFDINEDDRDEIMPDMSILADLKVGHARSKSGISGLFISLAEKLCRN